MGWLFNSNKAKNQAAQTPSYTGVDIQTSAYGKAIGVVYGSNRIATNLLWYGDFVQTAQQSQAGGGGGKGGGVGGGGGKGGGGAVTYTYSTAVAMALCEGPIRGVGTVYVDKNVVSLASLGFSLFTGTYPQTPWSYLTSKHSGQALGYNGIAYLANGSLQLGSSPNLSNYNFEVYGVLSDSIPGQIDADPSLVIKDILTNAKYGVGFPSEYIDDLTTYQNYCLALGLWISPAYTESQEASRILATIAAATNSEFFWSSGKLHIMPYGDSEVSGNGHTYTPNTVPLFELGDDDYLENQGTGGNTDPVAGHRERPADAYNQVQLEYFDRANNYNPAIADAKDEAAIFQYGLRTMGNVDAHLFCDGNAARMSSQLLLQRQAVRNRFTITTDLRYIVLDPMDIIAAYDAELGGLIPVRIRQMDLSQDESGAFSIVFTVEEYLGGVGSAPAYTFANGNGYNVNYNTNPGNVNTPVIFEPPVQITNTGLEVWMGVSGEDMSIWGGCQVWVSSDDTNYALAGEITGASRQGVLTATLPTNGVSPDLDHTLSVSLAMSNGGLLSGTQADANANHTLCYVDGELISYQTATLTGTNEYDLTYLPRGQFGTTISAHASGSQFLRLDSGIFTYPYDKSLIGQTLYAKFLSYNQFHGGLQNLADVPAFSHTLTGPPLPEQVQNFAATQSGNAVVFTWDDIASDAGLKGYDIAYGISGASWEQMKLLTEAARATEMTNAAVPPGTWDFVIRGHDVADNLGAQTRISDFVVVNSNPLIANEPQVPSWPGDLDRAVVHWTGVLMPQGEYQASAYDYIAPPAAPSLSQTAGGSFGATTYYVRITLTDSTGETLASAESSLAVSANNLLVVAHPSAAGAATGWNVYVSTSTGTEQLQQTGLGFGADWTLPVSGLVAGDVVPVINTTGQQVFMQYVPDPVSQYAYTTPVIDTGSDDTLRVFADTEIVPGYGNMGAATLTLSLDTWLTGDVDPDVFNNWTIGNIAMRYMRQRITITGVVQGSVPYVDLFTAVADKSPSTQVNNSFTVAPGGSTFTFVPPYHFPPFVQVTAISGSAVYATASSVTETDCVLNVWNTSGTSVGGTVNVTSTGE